PEALLSWILVPVAYWYVWRQTKKAPGRHDLPRANKHQPGVKQVELVAAQDTRCQVLDRIGSSIDQCGVGSHPSEKANGQLVDIAAVISDDSWLTNEPNLEIGEIAEQYRLGGIAALHLVKVVIDHDSL